MEGKVLYIVWRGGTLDSLGNNIYIMPYRRKKANPRLKWCIKAYLEFQLHMENCDWLRVFDLELDVI
jgi:hypothetical protein